MPNDLPPNGPDGGAKLAEKPDLPIAGILAGGASRRMGKPKATLLLAGQPLLRRVADRLARQTSHIVLIGGPKAWASENGLVHAPDVIEGSKGPLVGLLTLMDHAISLGAAQKHVFLSATDTPFLPKDLVSRLLAANMGNDRLVLPISDGQRQPLAALWPMRLRDELSEGLNQGKLESFRDLYKRAPPLTLPFDVEPFDPFFNINTPEDLVVAERLFVGS
jgi:molybdenum cofactor guanylyltransferase